MGDRHLDSFKNYNNSVLQKLHVLKFQTNLEKFAVLKLS